MRRAPEGERLEQRIRVERDGTVTALSGKIDFGQGLRTAFAQLVADELDVPIERVNVVLGDTAQVPFDFGTFGSHSVAQETPALRRAAASARRQLLERGSARLGVPAEALDTDKGAVTDRKGRTIPYGELLDGAPLTGPVPDDVPLMPESRRRYAGQPRPRLEATDIVTGRATYVADIRLPGMLRGAIVRPPQRGAKLRSVDDAAARAMPGVVAVVRDGDVLGVVAERDQQARAAAAAVEAEWDAAPVEGPTAEVVMRDDAGVSAALEGARTKVTRTYVLPAIANAPIGPSAAVADVRAEGATMYVGTHRPFGVREQVAKVTNLPEEKVRVLPQITSGTYGRNSHGDAALEAAVLSKAVGRPVLLQWTREEEFAWSPSRPEAVLEVTAALDGERITAWRYDEHTNVHTGAGLNPQVLGGTSGRNAIPPYAGFPARVTLHIEPTRLRTANFRSLAASENVFAIESFIDELAREAKKDPLAFRLAHLRDSRLRRVVERVVERSSFAERLPERRARGLACTIYHGTYVGQVAEVSVSTAGAVRLERFWCVVDPGWTVNPDGVRNQIEGGIQQSASWTLLEELRHRDGRVMTTGWDQYSIASFRDAPREIEVLVEGVADAPPTGVGEPGAVPVAAAIANAVYAACGARIRELPITRERVRAATAR